MPEVNGALIGKTCATCTEKLASSYAKVCVACLKEDTPGNRFPKYIKEKSCVNSTTG